MQSGEDTLTVAHSTMSQTAHPMNAARLKIHYLTTYYSMAQDTKPPSYWGEAVVSVTLFRHYNPQSPFLMEEWDAEKSQEAINRERVTGKVL